MHLKINLTINSLIEEIRTVIQFRRSVLFKPAYIILKENIRLRDENDREYLEYYVTFKFDNDEEQKYKVSFWQYHHLRAGTRGTLRLQDSLYKGFEEMKLPAQDLNNSNI